MSKLREQFGVNDRLREYIERMLSVIIENNPQLLEVVTNGEMPIRMLTSTTDQNQSLIDTTNESEDLPVPSEPVKSTTKSNDKYCRL